MRSTPATEIVASPVSTTPRWRSRSVSSRSVSPSASSSFTERTDARPVSVWRPRTREARVVPALGPPGREAHRRAPKRVFAIARQEDRAPGRGPAFDERLVGELLRDRRERVPELRAGFPVQSALLLHALDLRLPSQQVRAALPRSGCRAGRARAREVRRGDLEVAIERAHPLDAAGDRRERGRELAFALAQRALDPALSAKDGAEGEGQDRADAVEERGVHVLMGR